MLEVNGWSADTKDGDKLDVDIAYAGSELKQLAPRKVPSDTHTFQPYWGKPTVRNDRGDRGNVGIIRSPVRATILLAWRGVMGNQDSYSDILRLPTWNF